MPTPPVHEWPREPFGDRVVRGLADAVHEHALARPRATALVVEGEAWTWADLASAASSVAARLRAGTGATPRTATRRVGVLASRSLAAYAGILGATWAGAAWVPLGPKQPASRLASTMARAGLDALVVDARGAALVRDVAPAPGLPPLVLDESACRPRAGAIDAPAARRARDTAYVMFTSGTTGVPKGVVVPVGAVRHFLDAVRARYAIGPDDRVGQFCEATFDVSVFETFAAWEGGAALHVLGERDVVAPAAFVRARELTVWTSVPSVIALLARLRMLAPGSFPSLRASFFIGEPLTVESARAWQAAAPNSVVDNQYGPTEATVACTVQRVVQPAPVTPGRGTLAIGVEYDGMRAAVVGDGDAFLADGEVGELLLAGPQLADGYLDDEEQTARRFPVLDHPVHGRGRWYRTGDLAMRDRQGLLHCLGRVDHQLKVLGHRVELEDVEANLRVAAGCDAVAAVGWPVRDGLVEGIVAFVCGSDVATATIRERLRERLPSWMAPRRVLALDELPTGSSGKVDRAALVALLEQRASAPASTERGDA